MSTQTLTEAGRVMAAAILVDTVQINDVGPTVTVGINVTRSLTPVGPPVAGLVQTLKPQYALEGLVDNLFAVKVAARTEIHDGQAVTVVTCVAEPALVGKTLLLDKVSLNGLSMIRRATATDFGIVDQQGKGDLA